MEFKTSIRHMVEFIYRSGDITSSGNGTLSKEAMNAGSRIHRKLQKLAGSYYDAEVPLKITMQKGAYNLDVTVEGRADGIIDLRGAADKSVQKKLAADAIMLEQNIRVSDVSEQKEEQADIKNPAEVTVDEIKGVYKHLSDIEEPEFVHLAQAMCYAYIYAKEQKLADINVQITYVNLDSEDIKRFFLVFSYQTLEAWFEDTVDKMMEWVDFAVCHARTRDASIEKIEFPYEYRKGQKDMAACVYKAIDGGKRLFVQAPTGIGKTMAAVFPAVKAFSTGLVSKIFYLTAKTIASTMPDNAIEVLRKQGMQFSSVILTAKEKICPQEEMECDADVCPFAKGHYDRVNQALFDMITHETNMNRDTILAYAMKYTVCPFELGLDASLFADCIIGDYNYVFDTRVNLKRFFSQTAYGTGRYVFLVDEAHNLVERAQAMYSAAIYKEDFLELKKKVKPYSKKLVRSLESCNRELLDLKRNCEDGTYHILNDIGVLYLKCLQLHAALETFLEEQKQIPERKDVLEFYFHLTSFLNIAELLDDSYVIYDEILPDGRFMVKLYCVHPANNLKLCLDKGVSTIFFSATILPVKYYMEMLSNTETDRAIYIPSPFEQEKRKIFAGLDVTTRYTRRSISEYEKIYEYIKTVCQTHPGNYMVFFPSYQMMNQVYEIAAADESLEAELLLQEPNMREKDREDFLGKFEAGKQLVGFCIMGGIFSEGIDLTEERLIGAVVVGPGLPQVCNERKIMMDYFNARKNRGQDADRQMDGFKYAYLYPGINKVFQAAGRVIRTEKDRGVILLLDERFGRREYNELFPAEWQDTVFGSRKELKQMLDEFWDE